MHGELDLGKTSTEEIARDVPRGHAALAIMNARAHSAYLFTSDSSDSPIGRNVLQAPVLSWRLLLHYVGKHLTASCILLRSADSETLQSKALLYSLLYRTLSLV